jgi:CheY-like chemotaxis protein
MSGEEDDKATVVIDINALKKEKEMKEKEIADMAHALKFSGVPTETGVQQIPVIFFEFGGSLFQESKAQIPKDMNCKIIRTLPELNEWLKKKVPMVVVFPFDVNPKSVNQLSAQLKIKFKHVKTVFVAKALSIEKIKVHQASVAGAHAYLKSPFSINELKVCLDKILQKKAS